MRIKQRVSDDGQGQNSPQGKVVNYGSLGFDAEKRRRATTDGCELNQLIAPRETAKKLREIADAIESGLNFNVQINGHRVTVPKDARFEINLETSATRREVEIEMRWDRRKGQ